jgi:hypothetical protein
MLPSLIGPQGYKSVAAEAEARSFSRDQASGRFRLMYSMLSPNSVTHRPAKAQRSPAQLQHGCVRLGLAAVPMHRRRMSPATSSAAGFEPSPDDLNHPHEQHKQQRPHSDLSQQPRQLAMSQRLSRSGEENDLLWAGYR